MASNTRLLEEIEREKFENESVATVTSEEQKNTEENVLKTFSVYENVIEYDVDAPKLNRAKHLAYLIKSLRQLPSSYSCLDCSRPWLCYWNIHSLNLLGQTFSPDIISSISDFLSRCQCEEGGFGGGPGQLAHLAPTYAAVCALCSLNDPVAFNIINREKLVNFLWRVKQQSGAFTLHEGGEEDIRGVYCALAVARLTNIYTEELFYQSGEWVSSCQTYEGGFAGCPGLEAHGGYTFCGLAALVLLNRTRLCDLKALLRWSVNRQMRLEGGFQGRPNKLVDGCYSFWLGGVFPILHSLLAKTDSTHLEDGRWLFHQEAVQEYILMACQHVNGGLVDKPTKERDLYHACYVLSGLSVAQHSVKPVVLGCEGNLLKPVHPVFNICQEAATRALEYFVNLPIPSVGKSEP